MSKVYTIEGVNTEDVSPSILEELAEFAGLLNKDIYITSGFRKEDKGQHGLGLAVDIVVPGVKLLDLYLAAERFSYFTGIGVYPDWMYGGRKIGGLHLDARGGKPARWMGIGRGKDNKYIALNSDNLKKYGVV